MRLAVFFLAFIFLAAPLFATEIDRSSFDLPSNEAAYNRIRVAILQNRDYVKLFTPSPYRIETIKSGAVLDRGMKLPETNVAPSKSGIHFGAKNLRLYGFKVVSLNSSIRVDSKSYRESVQVLKDKNGKLLIINEVDLEEYLKGVLPREMWIGWPIEALKAQAVGSRTFAIFKSLSKSQDDFMLAGDIIGQVYGGHSSERASTDQVVDMTHGEVLTYDGKIFSAYFHATCAGQTTHPEYNWDIEPHPALRGVKCPYCATSKHFRWHNFISRDELKKRFEKEGHHIGAVRDVIPGKWDDSGRAREILIRHSRGDLTLRANDFRLIAGPSVVKSLKDLRVSYVGDQIHFAGYGWGHGVGMCQWGAKTLAEQGKTYREILEFYYPGSTVTKIKT